jgi:prepilin-type N-terminal cleavage/methylation domain-containing protein
MYRSFAFSLLARNKVTRNRGFTLIELLVVVSIISLLSAVVFASFNSAREKAQVGNVVSQFNEVLIAVNLYYFDTNMYPPDCDYDCDTVAEDPFVVNVGSVSGWNGPYFTSGVYKLAHPWGGNIGFVTPIDVDGDGIADNAIVLDDDPPGGPTTLNSGRIPTTALQRIDEILDDGNLATGKARGDGQALPGSCDGACVVGELIIKID